MQNTITVDKDNRPTSFSGESAVDIFRIRTLSSALGLLSHGIKPTRNLTLTRALAMATEYTGKKYKRTQIGEARQDLKKIENLRIKHVDIEKRG